MATYNTDIVIIGAGIAGLWLFHRLKKAGYHAILLEKNAIGAGQTIASQGIIHSGMKYAFAGKINKLAEEISAMPDLWRAAMASGDGDVDLRAAKTNADSQYMLIPSGFMGGLVKLVAKNALGTGVREIPKEDWPDNIKQSGFKGSVIFMNEPVLDIPSVIRALADPYKDYIYKIDWDACEIISSKDGISALKIGDDTIKAGKFIFTSAASNHHIAKQLGHSHGLQTQARPLLMGFLKPAPFEFYAHLVGSSDKPVATITTHKTADNEIVWYLGGGVAERAKESDPNDVISATIKGFKKYLPHIDLSDVTWATLPIDRIEGKSETDGWMPDTPTIHSYGNVFYCWPTKLTFSPLLSDRLYDSVTKSETQPNMSTKHQTCNFLPLCGYTAAPWDTKDWKKLN